MTYFSSQTLTSVRMLTFYFFLKNDRFVMKTRTKKHENETIVFIKLFNADPLLTIVNNDPLLTIVNEERRRASVLINEQF